MFVEQFYKCEIKCFANESNMSFNIKIIFIENSILLQIFQYLLKRNSQKAQKLIPNLLLNLTGKCPFNGKKSSVRLRPDSKIGHILF